MNRIFNEIAIPRSPFIPNFFEELKGTYNWELGNQQDSNEFMLNVLQNLYAKKNEKNENTGDFISNCPFNITFKSTRKCIMPFCTRHSQTYTKYSTLPLTIHTESPTSIQKLLDIHKCWEAQVDYNCMEKDDEDASHYCPGKKRNSVELIYSVSEYFIMQLNLFGFNRNTQQQCKLTPIIEVNKRIDIVGLKMYLFGIVFHCGSNLNVGHYTSVVLVDGNWFLTDDTETVTWTPQYFYDRRSVAFPYILVYRKSKNQTELVVEDIANVEGNIQSELVSDVDLDIPCSSTHSNVDLTVERDSLNLLRHVRAQNTEIDNAEDIAPEHQTQTFQKKNTSTSAKRKSTFTSPKYSNVKVKRIQLTIEDMFQEKSNDGTCINKPVTLGNVSWIDDKVVSEKQIQRTPKKNIQENDAKKVVVDDVISLTGEAQCKLSLINELNYQASQVAHAKSESSKLSNLNSKKKVFEN